MFLTKKHLSRRTVLRGAGVTLALPLLDSMIPASTALASTAANPIPRFVAVFGAHGWAPTWWHDGRWEQQPQTDGRNIGLGYIHEPLAPYKSKLTICAGLDAYSSMSPAGSNGGDHSRTAAALTGASPRRTSGADIYCGISLDQVIAQKYGQTTLRPSIQVTAEDPGANTGICGTGYSCVYTNSLSWVSPTQPLPHEFSPLRIFELLFGDGTTAAERAARRRTNASILDELLGRVVDLNKTLPKSDQSKLDDYLSNIREVERRSKLAAAQSGETVSMVKPEGVPQSFDANVKLLWDLQHIALQADITRVSSFLFAHDASGQAYPESGINTPNHAASHHGEDPVRIREFAQINRYHMASMAYFLDKLKNTPDGDGTLFDHSLLLYTSNMGNANSHSHVGVGQLLVGGGSGRHNPRRINLEERGSTSNFLLSVLHMYGIDMPTFGDSNGVVSI